MKPKISFNISSLDLNKSYLFWNIHAILTHFKIESELDIWFLVLILFYAVRSRENQTKRVRFMERIQNSWILYHISVSRLSELNRFFYSRKLIIYDDNFRFKIKNGFVVKFKNFFIWTWICSVQSLLNFYSDVLMWIFYLDSKL